MRARKAKEILLTKKERTKKQLVRGALKVLARKDLGDISISDFTHEAELANGTFYNYFQSKDELMQSVSLSIAEDLAHSIEKSFVGDEQPYEKLATGAMVFFRKAYIDQDWARSLIRIALSNPQLTEALRLYPLNDIRKAKKLGKFDFSSEEAALNVFLGSIFFSIKSLSENHWKVGEEKEIVLLIFKALGMKEVLAKKTIEKVWLKVWV